MRKSVFITLAAALSFAFVADSASAACVNRYLARREGVQQVVTLLTGKLTFQEAQELAASIRARKSPPLEWVDESGKSVAVQFKDLKVVRPMPVGCDGKSSGVIMIVNFGSSYTPGKKMHVKLNANTTVAFDQQQGE